MTIRKKKTAKRKTKKRKTTKRKNPGRALDYFKAASSAYI